MVDLSVKVGGSMSNPQLKIDLEKVVGDAMNDIKDQAKDFAQAKLDSAKARVKDSLNAVSEKLKEKVKDKIRDQIFGKDTTKSNTVADTSQKPKPDIKKKLKDIFNKPKKNAADTSGH
jgi:hypothetical protein